MGLKTARGTRALLHLEDESPDILFERLPGAEVPLWPTVRTEFMVAMQHHDFGSVSLPAAPATRVRTWAHIARSLFGSRWDSHGIREARAALYLVSGVTTYQAAGRTRNWLVGDYLDRYPSRSALLQWRPIGPTPPAFPLTRSLEPMVIRSGLRARFSRRSVDGARVRVLVREFADRLDDRLTNQQVDAISSTAIYAAATAQHQQEAFARVLDAVDPRLVVMEDASYGTRGALISTMKARGILVVEPQHGWIGPTHAAYNFGSAMSAPELSVTLPDELLTFGEYWSEGIRHPAPSTAIGKPHLETMATLAPRWSDRPREVLMVSSVTDPEAMTEFALALRRELPTDWLLRFRPHPSERPVVQNVYASMLAVPGIALDEVSDVYESLARARGIVGIASTVLFEALAMGCRVFVLDSAFADYYVGELFGPTVSGASGAGGVARRLIESAPAQNTVSRDAIWKPGAVDNFARWAEARFGW